MADELLGRQSAVAEARALYRMISDEHTVEELCELTAVPPKIEDALLAFAKVNPCEAHWIEAVLRFREATLREFERIVSENEDQTKITEQLTAWFLGLSREGVRRLPSKAACTASAAWPSVVPM